MRSMGVTSLTTYKNQITSYTVFSCRSALLNTLHYEDVKMAKEKLMSKFNTANVRAANGAGVITTNGVPTTTFNGGKAVKRTEKSELFLLAAGSFFGENAFYEGKDARAARFVSLSRTVAVADPTWFTAFVQWLRAEGNMRTGSLVIALEGADALRTAGIPGGRAIVAAALTRADEPGEALAYWISQHGRKIPQAIKRGIADAAVNTYNEYSLAKYDSARRGFRFGDVIALVHPTPRGGAQSALFKYALDRRRGAKVAVPSELGTLVARNEVLAMSKTSVRDAINASPEQFTATLSNAGLTWEALSGMIEGGMDAKAWEAVIPTMGYMALLRNLRNFEKAGVSESVLTQVAARIQDTDEIAKSRQFPMRFLSAFRATSGSLRFGFPLEKALAASIQNVPALTGNTLILVDRSGSMFYSTSARSDLDFADSAALFGAALAVRAENATLVEFGTSSREVAFKKTDSVLNILGRFNPLGGTDTVAALNKHYNKSFDRVIILTDEQYNYSGSQAPGSVVDASVPLYTFNLVGYVPALVESATNRYTFGGLTDASFRTIPMVEAGRSGVWPWEG